jgi:hypothetical protein
MMSFENEPKIHKQQILLWMCVEKGRKTRFETNLNEPRRDRNWIWPTEASPLE